MLVGFAIAAIAAIYGHHLHNTVHIASSWFTLSGGGRFKALISGILLSRRVMPLLGAAFMASVIIYSLATDSLNGIEIVFGFGFALVGLVISFIVARTGHAPYYTDPTTSDGDHIESELAEPEAS